MLVSLQTMRSEPLLTRLQVDRALAADRQMPRRSGRRVRAMVAWKHHGRMAAFERLMSIHGDVMVAHQVV